MKTLLRVFLHASLVVLALYAISGSAYAEKFGSGSASDYYQGTSSVENQWIELMLAGGAKNGLNGPFIKQSDLDDNATQLVDIGFNFNFFGIIYTKLYINLNGYLIMQPAAGAATPSDDDLTRNLGPLGNAGDPNPDGSAYVLWSNYLPDALIAPFCANLTFAGAPNATLYYQTVGSGDKKIFIVQWRNVPLYNKPTQIVSMQIQLHENGFIYFVYETVPDSLADTTEGSRWTGLENELGTTGITYTTTQSSIPSQRIPYTLSSGLNLLFYSNQDTAKLTVVSAYGNPSPPVGEEVPRPKNSLITAIVEQSVAISAGIRFRCTGWVGTGSCPASWDGTGAPNFVTFEIREDSSITWQWLQEFSIHVTSLGNNGNPSPIAGTTWYPAFTQVTLSVTTPYQSWDCTGYAGSGDIGTGTETSFTITVTQPSTIIWNWEYSGGLKLSFAVITSFGTPSPSGITLWDPGQQVTASVQATIVVGGVTYVCSGYTGTGSVPAVSPPNANSVTFTILVNSSITWNWVTQGGGTNQLIINSPFPPLPGYTRLFGTEYVDVSAQSPVEGDGYRWICTGFSQKYGSPITAPSTASSFRFLITANTEIDFLWEIYYRLTVVSGVGDVLYGEPQLSVGGGSDIPVQKETWWSNNMPFVMTVTTPYIPLGATGVRYTCTGWDGTGNIPQTDNTTSSVALFMNQPARITFNWQTEYLLTILNPRNLPGPSPSVGSYWLAEGTAVTGNCIRTTGYYTCVGFNASGSLTNSANINFNFAINTPTTVEWLWQLNLPSFADTMDVELSTTGLYTALARETPSGLPWIAYFDSDFGDLIVANYNGTTWNKRSVATIGTVGQYATIVLDNRNYPHIAYYNSTDGDLYYATWTGVNWQIILVDGDGDVGQYASISLITTPSGIVPAIAYYDATKKMLKYAERSGDGFSKQDVTAIGNDRGKFCSLGFDGFRNIPSIAYYDATTGDLMYATRIGGVWNSVVVSSEGDVGRFASLSFNADNLPGIAYYDLTNRDLKFIQKTADAWLSPVTVDSDGDVGQFCSLRFTTTNIPMISYSDYGRERLKFAYFNGVQWVTMVLDSTGNNVGWYTSLALDLNGNPGISYATANSIRYKYIAPAAGTQDPTGGGVVITPSSGGCFIATSAFGTISAASVNSLCNVRDNSLMSFTSGSSIVSLYYAVSPAIANEMRNASGVRALARALLTE